jgi:DNA-binding transcriptional LysR family regulator
VRLFDRTPDGFSTTTAGQEIVEVAERMESDVLALESRVLGRDTRLSGKLRVATMDMFFRRFSDAFAAFIERHPSVELTVIASDKEVSLTRREADVALRMTDTPPEYLVGRKIGRVRFAVYGAKKLVERVRAAWTEERAEGDYSAYPWLHWDERQAARWLDVFLAKKAPGARVAMRMDMSLLRPAVSAGIGVHFLACFEGDADPDLQRLGPVEREFGRDLWLLTLPELRSTSRVRAFMDHMSDALCAERGALQGDRSIDERAQ